MNVKRAIKAFVATAAAVAIIVGLFFVAMAPQQAQAEPQNIGIDLPVATVSIKVPVTIRVEATVRVTTRVEVPGPTVRVEIPGPTQTVRVPGATRTVQGPIVTRTRTVEKPVPGPTTTIRVEDGETTTMEPSAAPTTTVSSEPENNSMVVKETETKTETIVDKVGIGLAATLVLIALLLSAMWLAYGWGMKDNERRETSFMKSLLRRKN